MTVRWAVTRQAAVVDGDTAEGIATSFLNQPEWCNILSTLSFSLMLLISDIVTVSYSCAPTEETYEFMLIRHGDVG